MNKKAQQLESKTTKLLILPKFIKAFALIIGLSSFFISCNTNSKLSEKEKLVHRFFADNIKAQNGAKIYIAIISSDCQECINTNIYFIKKWNDENRTLTYLIDPNMLVEVSSQVPDINKCSIKIDPNILVKYGITEGRMLVMYAKDGELEEIDIIPDGVKTYNFKL